MDFQQVSDWKRQYGEVFSASIRGCDYVFRALTLDEYGSFMDQSDSAAETEERIAVTAVLSPPLDDLDSISAGIVTTLAEEILNVSGHGDPKRAKGVLDQKRYNASEANTYMKAFVIAAMPAYTIEDLGKFTYSQLAEKVAFAEKVIEIRQAMFPVASQNSPVRFELIDPEEEEQQSQQAVQKHAAQKPGGQAGLRDPIAQKLHQAMPR